MKPAFRVETQEHNAHDWDFLCYLVPGEGASGDEVALDPAVRALRFVPICAEHLAEDCSRHIDSTTHKEGSK